MATSEPSSTLDERYKIISLGLGVAAVFVSLGTGRFLSTTAQRTVDICILTALCAFCAIFLILPRRSWMSKFQSRTLKKDCFWFLYRLIFRGANPPYNEPWVQKWDLSYCHPICKGPYLKEKVSHIIVDDEYKDQKLIISSTAYPFLGRGYRYHENEMDDHEFEKRYPGAREYVRRLLDLVNEKLAPSKFTEASMMPHATSPWSMDTCRIAAMGVGGSVAIHMDKHGEMYENTLNRFEEIFASAELKGVIDMHMNWIQVTQRETKTREIVISPGGFYIVGGYFSFMSLGSLSILQVRKHACVYVYDHNKKTTIFEKSYELDNARSNYVLLALSLWACSPTQAIHTDVRVLKGGTKLKTNCYTLEESIEYCMKITGDIKLAAIRGTGELFDVSAK